MSMTTIRNAIETTITMLNEHPEKARRNDAPATAVLQAGLSCSVQAADGSQLRTDMPKAVGGEESAPTPGWLMRAALAACDTTMIASRAAQEGISLTRLEVTVDSDSDARGLLGLNDAIEAGPQQIRMHVRISAPEASPERLREIVDWAQRHSPVGDALERAVPSTLTLEIL